LAKVRCHAAALPALRLAGGEGRLARLIATARTLPPPRTAIIHPVDDNALRGAMDAAAAGLLVPVLVGPEARIRAAAAAGGIEHRLQLMGELLEHHQLHHPDVPLERMERPEERVEGGGVGRVNLEDEHALLDVLQQILGLCTEDLEHLGIGVTAPVSYEPPFTLARRFSTLDHLTKGRVAWNIVTGYSNAASRAVGRDNIMPHDPRYDLADEFLEIADPPRQRRGAETDLLRRRPGSSASSVRSLANKVAVGAARVATGAGAGPSARCGRPTAPTPTSAHTQLGPPPGKAPRPLRRRCEHARARVQYGAAPPVELLPGCSSIAAGWTTAPSSPFWKDVHPRDPRVRMQAALSELR
jgi:hypothetical protein